MTRLLKRVAVLVSSTTLISSLLITAVGAAILQLVASPATVSALDSDTYSWPNAPCEFSNGGTSCENPDQTDYPGDMYDWYENGGNPFSGTLCYYGTNSECFDPTWKFEYRNCTDYVAQKIYQKFGVNITSSWGNANNWLNYNTNTAHYPTDPTSAPQVGDIAVWTGGSFGHVAYVASVSGSTATFDEYNENSDGNFTNNLTTTNHGTPNGYIHIGTINDGSTTNLVSNGDFNVNAASWNTTASANMAQYPGNQNQASYEGAGYLSTNSPQSGGSVYQDISVTIASGNMYCLEAELTSIGSSGGNGTLAIWLTGGSYSESSSYVFANLPQSTWTPFKTCVTATTSHTTIRAQIYDSVGSPTIGIDAVDVHRSLVKNGEFNTNAGYWNTTAGANMTQYPGNQNQASYEGAGYLATNSPQSGGSVYQDIPLTISAGNMYCLETEITSIGSSGAHGSLALWLNGGSNAQESSYYVFSNLPQSTWKPFKTCITATLSHTNIRAQVYDDVGSPTIGIDAVDVHRSLVQNGEFNVNAGHWNTTNSANMAQYPGNQNQASYEGAGYLSTNSPQSGGSVYQDIPLTISTGNMYCLEAEITSIGSSGGNGTLAIWLTGGNNTESSSYVFSNLPQSTWTPFKTCVTATTSHTNVRVQVYDNVGSPSIGIDAVDVH